MNGLKVGLEIHQQLDVGKLFCSCPSELRKDEPDFVVRRKLRAVAGELGQVDKAAKFEQAKGFIYFYEGYEDTTCLVELDEEPPHPINKEALKTVLQIALMLNCQIPKRIQVMRKMVVDGSNTSGFQRTALIGLNGWIETPYGKVRIPTICLEEDAARRISEDKESVRYRLDRLGIPLIEIATAPEMTEPEQVKFVARQIGLLLRATGKAKRGIGTIRQDINISMSGHPRIELKGVQDLRSIPQVVRKEAERQQEVLKSGEKPEPHVRNVKPDGSSKYLRPMPGEARMYPETDIPLIEISPKMLRDLKKNLPEPPDKKLERVLKKAGVKIGQELKEQALNSSDFDLILKFVDKYPKIAKVVFSTILGTQKEARRKAGQEFGEFSEEHFDKIFGLLSRGKITKEAILDVLIEVARGKPVEEVAKKFRPLSTSELKREIARLKKKFAKVPAEKLKGVIIGKLRGRAKVEDVLRFLKNS